MRGFWETKKQITLQKEVVEADFVVTESFFGLSHIYCKNILIVWRQDQKSNSWRQLWQSKRIIAFFSRITYNAQQDKDLALIFGY